MSEFKEFDQQGSVPSRNTGSIISHAFEMYKGVFLYAVIMVIIYLIADYILQSIAGLNLYSYYKLFNNDEVFYRNFLIENPDLSTYYPLTGFLSVISSPLYIGLIYITNKYNTKVTIEFSDLFIGYRQNLGNILLYSLIVNIILGISAAICFIPLLFVFPLFLLGYPILLFENSTAIDALSKTFTIAKENYGVFLGVSILGGLISLGGLVFCCIGFIFTYPFLCMIAYSTYCAYLGKPRQIKYHK